MQNEQDEQLQDTFKIYRIENPVLGCGPMSGKDGELPDWDELFEDHPAPSDSLQLIQWLHKTSQFDDEYVIPEHLYFGLDDRERLYNLISNENALNILINSGYKLCTYEIKKSTDQLEMNYKVFSYLKQVCFNLRNSTLIKIEELSLDEFEKYNLT